MSAAKGKPTSKPALHDALARTSKEPRRPLGPLASSSLRAAVRESLAATNRLREYRQYLAAARDRKSKVGLPSAALADLVLQARRASDDMRALTARGVEIAQHVNQSGAMTEALSHTHRLLRETGPSRISDLWSELSEDAETKEVLREAGFSDDLLAALAKELGSSDVILEAGKNDTIRVRDESSGRSVALRTGPREGRKRRPSDVLFAGEQAVAIAALLGDSAVASLDAVPWVDDDDATAEREVEALESVVAGATLLRQESVRHVRKLEDTGLEVYGGRDPATLFIGALIVAVIFLAAGIALRVACPNRHEKEHCYNLGSAFLAIAAAMFAVAQVTAILSVVILGYEAWDRSMQEALHGPRYE